MHNAYEDIEILIAKVLAEEASPEETTALDAWRTSKTENQRYFEDLQRLWDLSAAARPSASRPINTESALQRVKKQLETPVYQPLKARKVSMRFWMQAAAAVMLLAVAVFMLRPEKTAPEQEIASNNATILVDTLSDGSVVTLNRNSGLTVASRFNKKERRIKLHGEAYFEVAHNQAVPFFVEVQALEIKVVGTAFNVDNRSMPGQVIVTVSEGKVLVKHLENSVLLVAGDQAIYDEQTGRITKLLTQQYPNALAYKNRILKFEATPMNKVMEEIQNAYNVSIVLKNKNLAQCPLSGNYNNLSLERLFELIAETFNLQVTKQPNGQWMFDGAGCGE